MRVSLFTFAFALHFGEGEHDQDTRYIVQDTALIELSHQSLSMAIEIEIEMRYEIEIKYKSRK